MVIIPSRYGSTRFPGKPLAEIDGVPMVARVAKNACEAFGKGTVFVTSDHADIIWAARTKTDAAGTVLVDEDDVYTGTDRVALAVSKMSRDLADTVVINLQGDEPMVDHNAIRRVAYKKLQNYGHIVCGMTTVADHEDPDDETLVKVEVDEAMNLKRASRKNLGTGFRQVGIYAFTPAELRKYSGEQTPLELEEGIEILRCLDLGMPIKMVPLAGSPMAVDLPEHIAEVEERIRVEK
jgi:3-deoxy-manno-octulosonate cytidylyltransferase (CMP-KDO synthetase)